MSEVSDDQKCHWLHVSSECKRIKTLPKIAETIIIRYLWGWELNIVRFDTMSLFIKIVYCTDCCHWVVYNCHHKYTMKSNQNLAGVGFNQNFQMVVLLWFGTCNRCNIYNMLLLVKWHVSVIWMKRQCLVMCMFSQTILCTL